MEIERLWLRPEELCVLQASTNISAPIRVPNLTEHVPALGFSEFTIPSPMEVFRFMAAFMPHRSEGSAASSQAAGRTGPSSAKRRFPRTPGDIPPTYARTTRYWFGTGQ